MKMKLMALCLLVAFVSGCLAGWLNPTQQGFVIQTFTTYEPMSGNNSGTIITNGNSYQFAGDNTGWMWIGGPGSQFRGKNDGQIVLNGDGAFVLGSFGSLASVTNQGKGSLLLGNLSGGQKAMITDVGNAAILLGAGTVSNSQSIVVGDDLGSHGTKSVTAGAFWAMGDGFFGNGVMVLGSGIASNIQSIVVGDGNASHGTKSVTAGSVWAMGAGFFGNGAGLSNLAPPAGYVVNDSCVAVGDSANGSDGTAIGREANGSEGGTALGLLADGSSYGVAVGQESIGSFSGSAVGYSADGTAGAAVGYGSLGAYGAAVGTFSCGSAYGAAIGVSASGYSYGVGIGSYSVGNGLGNVALGGGEEGGLIAAIPAGFTDTVELGRGTAVSNGWLHFRGHPVVDANGGIYPGAIKGFVSTNDLRYRATVTNGASPSFKTVTATDFSLGAVGKFMILGGTQLVFVAGSVTNVLDSDVGRP
jgi:hypothetical protein